MKRTLHGITLATALLAGGVTLAQSAAPSTMPAKPAATAKGGMVEHMGFMVPSDEKAFLERIHHINKSEIEQAKLAQTASQNADVKKYADDMIKMHTDADAKLMSYAEGKKMKLADMPKPMDDMEKKAMAAEKADMDKLKALKGAPFDSCYMAGQVGAHDMAIGKVMAAMSGMNAQGELSTMLTNLSQELPKHRQMAYDVLGKLPQKMGMGGSGDMGTMDHGSMNKGTMGGSTTGGTMGGSTTGGTMGGATGTGTMGGSTKTK